MRVIRYPAARLGLAITLVLIVAAAAVPFLSGLIVRVDLPPLHAEWDPRVGAGTIPAVALALLAAWFAVDLARRVPWWILVIATAGAAAAWMVALALVDGVAGLGAILDRPSEYLATARSITDVGTTLHEYISRIPLDADRHWPVHLAGHPPGALLFFVGLVRIGLGSATAAGLAIIAIAATTPVAVLITLRRLGAGSQARLAAPFLAFGPAAIWSAVSADALFAAVAAWGLCFLAVSATSPRTLPAAGWSLAAGLLLGYCVMLSYGLPLLALPAIAVLVAARNPRPLPGATLGALAVVLAFAATGFAWWEAYPVLVERYYDGIAQHRPYGYWVWADLAALAICAGPLVGSAIAVAATRLIRLGQEPLSRVIALLVSAAAASVLLADLSGMSKAEVERIWLPFVPWLLTGTALLPERWRRVGLLGQLVVALAVQHLVRTPW